MEAIKLDNLEQIRTQLVEMGFEDVDDMLANCHPLYNKANSSLVGISLRHLDEDVLSHSLGFKIDYRKITDCSMWEPESSHYTIKIPTRRKPEGYKLVSRYWFASEGPLPHKDYMRWIVNRAAKIETVKEAMLSDWMEKPSAADQTMVSTKLMHSALKSDLDHLGFQIDSGWVQTTAYADGFTFLSSRERFNIRQPEQNDQVQLFIAVANADLKIPPRVEYINAAVLRNHLDKPQIISEGSYWLNEGGLPPKEHILRTMLTRLNMRDDSRLGKAASIARRITVTGVPDSTRPKQSGSRLT